MRNGKKFTEMSYPKDYSFKSMLSETIRCLPAPQEEEGKKDVRDHITAMSGLGVITYSTNPVDRAPFSLLCARGVVLCCFSCVRNKLCFRRRGQ